MLYLFIAKRLISTQHTYECEREWLDCMLVPFISISNVLLVCSCVSFLLYIYSLEPTILSCLPIVTSSRYFFYHNFVPYPIKVTAHFYLILENMTNKKD